ncbi:MAG: cytochrome c [Polyangiales bacterium]
MSTKHKTPIESLAVLLAVSALLALAMGCGQGDSARAPVSADEYEIITQQQEEALEAGTMPLGQAMSQYASKPRDQFAALAPQPSEDESALNGWSFKGAAPIAAGDVTMPPECVGAANPEACWGQKLSNSKGCMACHAVDGVKQQPCPNWKGLFGKERPLVSGETVVADEAYLASSISNSWDQVVQGYGKTMPPYNFPEQEIAALVAYLKSLGEGG